VSIWCPTVLHAAKSGHLNTHIRALLGVPFTVLLALVSSFVRGVTSQIVGLNLLKSKRYKTTFLICTICTEIKIANFKFFLNWVFFFFIQSNFKISFFPIFHFLTLICVVASFNLNILAVLLNLPTIAFFPVFIWNASMFKIHRMGDRSTGQNVRLYIVKSGYGYLWFRDSK
jgi:hypothetical protein